MCFSASSRVQAAAGEADRGGPPEGSGGGAAPRGRAICGTVTRQGDAHLGAVRAAVDPAAPGSHQGCPGEGTEPIHLRDVSVLLPRSFLFPCGLTVT